MTAQYTPGPWKAGEQYPNSGWVDITSATDPRRLPFVSCKHHDEVANARLIAEAPALVDALREGVRAIGDHFAPNDCYVTGPVTGDLFRDLVQCPACSFLAMAEPILARIDGDTK